MSLGTRGNAHTESQESDLPKTDNSILDVLATLHTDALRPDSC